MCSLMTELLTAILDEVEMIAVGKHHVAPMSEIRVRLAGLEKLVVLGPQIWLGESCTSPPSLVVVMSVEDKTVMPSLLLGPRD
jgi:hypothetical protein